ncbi:hypothetical protein CONLIGDRAFT_630046 [Coniochaeta ligniaria NRRL 30616]|uniref:Cysteine-rich transmembrane CYSTM domain-containing protein n=1 Tax=Coniochaeta ligniaria NRRL 30616 TaxID=1408157 RepID=A0A1J7JG89_9PEZI|nr:hypothetical protein CONLIGDRAFT_630046 [Coniochaeta ligniaria NRRL 30616]
MSGTNNTCLSILCFCCYCCCFDSNAPGPGLGAGGGSAGYSGRQTYDTQPRPQAGPGDNNPSYLAQAHGGGNRPLNQPPYYPGHPQYNPSMDPVQLV